MLTVNVCVSFHCSCVQGRKRRGGRRLRKMKERYGLTDMRQAQNRMNFNQQEEEYMDGDEVSLGIFEGVCTHVLVQVPM